MFWNPKEQLKSSTFVEVSQPDKILDQASSEPITQVTLKQINDDKTYMIAVNTESALSVFYTKSIGGGNGNKPSSVAKGKVVKKECFIKRGAAHEQLINTSLVNETTLSLVHGSIFSLKRSQIKLLDDEGKVQKDITLNSSDQANGVTETVQKKSGNDQYQVMGIEDEGNAKVNSIMT